ncbi:hypothetical protein ScPMuIL_002142 [Solemya velum]
MSHRSTNVDSRPTAHRSSCNIAGYANSEVFMRDSQEEEYELTPQDGWFNNLVHPDWGGIDGQLLRLSPADYSDGVYEPSGRDRPNPFLISEAAHQGPSGLGSLRNRTAMMVYFGQQVVEEVLDAQRPGLSRDTSMYLYLTTRTYKTDSIQTTRRT